MHSNSSDNTPPAGRDSHLLGIAEALSRPFDPSEIKFKPQVVKDRRALAMAYIDARLIQDRLDTVLGVENWQDRYELLTDGSVICRLRLKLGSHWVTKTDVGSPSEQPDSGDRLKAAFSDALKRAAVKFGIGRYLYRLPAQWVEYDPVKKQLVRLPTLPTFALPKPDSVKDKSSAAQRDEKAVQAPAAPVETPCQPPQVEKPNAVSSKPNQKESPKHSPVPPKPSLPANGEELQRRLQEYDAKLAARKMCPRGALLNHVVDLGLRAGFTANLTEWSGPAIRLAVDAVKGFEQTLRSSEKSEPKTAA
jgi:hypothetical protein